jgi:FkbH-like protein
MALQHVQQHAGVRSLRDLPALLNALAWQLLAKANPCLVEELLSLSAEWQTPFSEDIHLELAKAWSQRSEFAKARKVLHNVLKRTPTSSEPLLALYELAKTEQRSTEAHALLNQLIEADPSLSTAVFAYKERSKLPPDSGRPVRLALLSSYVLDQLIPFLDFECRRVGLVPEFYLAPFNQFTQEILNHNSALYSFNPELVFLAVSIEDLFPGFTEYPSHDELMRAKDDVTNTMLRLVKELQQSSGALVIVSDFGLMHYSPHGLLDNRLPQGLLRWTTVLNQVLADAFAQLERTFLLPLFEVLSWVGKARAKNPKMDYMASMRLSDAALPELARYCMRYVKPLKGLTKKCVVLDLDGTLWGGIVGELGPEGIQLGPTVPGKEYMEFQRALLNLTRRGTLLAICSKNNPEDVLPVLREHKYMILREEHFAAMRINWRNKAENIKEIVEELNIGPDSLVFIDDNPNERELVRQLLPEVLTIELPRDPSHFRMTLESLSDFELLAVTKEDEMRMAQYQAIGKRKAMRNAIASLEDYLYSLALKVTIELAKPEGLNRLVQMCNKTNQFNLTTPRYQTADVERFLKSNEYRVYTLGVSDRFVDHGIVGTAVVRVEPNQWRIDTLLMSCRVMGLTIEQAFLARLCQDALEASALTLLGEFIPSKKNHPAKDFYFQSGFSLQSDTGGHQIWEYQLATFKVKTPPWITVTGDK